MHMKLCTFLLLAIVATNSAYTQAIPTRRTSHEFDLAVGYNTQRSSGTGGASFWQQGGLLEVSAQAYRGLGFAVLISGGHIENRNGSGTGLDMITTTFGPRYTLSYKGVGIFGEGLIGNAKGFHSVFPATSGAMTDSDSFALQLGGGIDLRISSRLAVRPLQATWLRTQFPNGTTNVQNNLQLGAGIVFRLQR